MLITLLLAFHTPRPEAPRPVLAKVELASGATILAPVASWTRARPVRLELPDGSVIEFEDARARWLGEFHPVELAIAGVRDPEALGRGPACEFFRERSAPRRVWRLDANPRAARALTTFESPALAKELPIALCEAGGALFAVLAASAEEGAATRLVAFDTEEKQRASIAFAATAPRADSGVRLLAARMPTITASVPILLQEHAGAVLACARGGEELVRVAPDGKVLARIERVHEFERGYIGPSVWTHRLTRFSIEVFEGDATTTAPALDALPEYRDARSRFETEFEAGVIGGPIVVGERVFVATARARKSPWSAMLARATVYELDRDLRPIGLVELPQVPIGSLAIADRWRVAPALHLGGPAFMGGRAGVAWALQSGGLAFIASTTDDDLLEHGPGGWDRLLRIDWLRGAAARERKPWLRTDPSWRGMLFAEGVAVACADGGFVASKEERVFRFPLRRIDLASGAETALELRVPFEGELTLPTTNFTVTGTSTRALGAYGIGLVDVARVGRVLRIAIATEAARHELDFELARTLH